MTEPLKAPADTPRRLFVAVMPPADVVDELAAQRVSDPLRPVRWTPTGQWHVTLLFTPAVGAAVVDGFSAALSEALAPHAPFPLAVRGGGAFPRLQRSRHVIALLDDPTGSLPQLNRACRAAADALGIDHEDRPYQPHLTLGRTNRPVDRTADAAWLAGLHTRTWQVDEVALVESVLQPSGAHHTVTGRFRLQG